MVTVLIAEDEDIIRSVYAQGLSAKGFRVIEASDGNEAVTKLRAEHPDVLLLDLSMPNKDGFEVLAEVQGDVELRSIPVIVLSHADRTREGRRCEALGAAKYLQKVHTTLDALCREVHSCCVQGVRE